MSEMSEYWRDVKAHFDGKKRKYQEKISNDYNELCNIAKEVGDHHRIGDWDFWYTGTVINIKTKERITLKELKNKYENLQNKWKGNRAIV